MENPYSDPGRRHAFHIIFLVPKQVIPLLRALKKASEDHSWFMSEEGFVLSRVPETFFGSKIPLAFFYVRWLASGLTLALLVNKEYPVTILPPKWSKILT